MNRAKQDENAASLVARIGAIETTLRLLSDLTGLGFVAVTRIEDRVWTACAVFDTAGYGIKPGTRLDANEMLCTEVHDFGRPIAIDCVAQDPVYASRPEPKIVGYESYIAVPIVLESGERFGTLCAWDRHPAKVNDPKTKLLFLHFAQQIGREIHSQRAIDSTLGELLDEREGGAARERFIAILGHDLRNPLASISNCAQLLQLKSKDPDTLNYAARILASVGRMVTMVADLMDLARGTQGGGIKVTDEVIHDLGVSLGSVVDELRIAYPMRQLQSEIHVDCPVRGDRGRLQQLLSNLVGNAITHGSESAPITVRALTENGQLDIEVHNEGTPIPQDSVSGLFDPFTQGRTSANRGEGLGLGLYICEQIATAHGGSLTVHSTESGGTLFRATLPCLESPEPATDA